MGKICFPNTEILGFHKLNSKTFARELQIVKELCENVIVRHGNENACWEIFRGHFGQSFQVPTSRGDMWYVEFDR